MGITTVTIIAETIIKLKAFINAALNPNLIIPILVITITVTALAYY